VRAAAPNGGMAMRLRVAVVIGAVGAALLLGSPRRAAASSWAEVRAAIQQRFPAVASITTTALAARLADPSGPPPLLLDARTPEEYAVSHLAGARLTPDLAAARAVLAGRPMESEVVVYCVVGYRSAALAAALHEAGYEQVLNLDGSIFQWANEGRPVYCDGGRDGEGDERPVRAVHPYDRRWGLLLHRDLWSWRRPR